LADKESRLAFISDVHSNLEALEAVLDETGKLKVFCAGDIVGYGASPNEVVRVLKGIGATCVKGNHDEAVVTGDAGEFNPRAAMAVTWTTQHVTDETREFLAALPTHVSSKVGDKALYMTHGSPDDPMWEYVLPSTHSDLMDYYLKKVGADVMAVGHSHMPFEWRGESGVVFNPGSVGQPRTGDRRASFAIVSVEGGEVKVEHRMVEYDVERAAKKVLDSGLPPSLASQLLSGE
jgi:putative phosphoesterase